MPHGQPRDSRKEQQWRHWFHLWQHSGLTVRAFCDRHGLSQPSFYAWRRRLQAHPAAASTFVPVHVVADEPAPATPQSFELVLPSGRCLRVPPGFEPAALRQLLAVLQEAWPC